MNNPRRRVGMHDCSNRRFRVYYCELCGRELKKRKRTYRGKKVQHNFCTRCWNVRNSNKNKITTE